MNKHLSVPKLSHHLGKHHTVALKAHKPTTGKTNTVLEYCKKKQQQQGIKAAQIKMQITQQYFSQHCPNWLDWFVRHMLFLISLSYPLTDNTLLQHFSCPALSCSTLHLPSRRTRLASGKDAQEEEKIACYRQKKKGFGMVTQYLLS